MDPCLQGPFRPPGLAAPRSQASGGSGSAPRAPCSPGTTKAVKAQSGRRPLAQAGRPSSDGSTSNRGACSPNLLVWDSQGPLREVPPGHQSGSNQKVFTTLSTQNRGKSITHGLRGWEEWRKPLSLSVRRRRGGDVIAAHGVRPFCPPGSDPCFLLPKSRPEPADKDP